MRGEGALYEWCAPSSTSPYTPMVNHAIMGKNFIAFCMVKEHFNHEQSLRHRT